MSRLRAVLLVCGVCAAAPARGASPDPKSLAVPPAEVSRARELVGRLGSASYRDREDATAELAKMGRLAKQALAEATTTEADPEVRARTTRLLPKAEADDLKARIDTYLEDKDGKFDHDLPGLKAFRAAAGANAKARELYVEILNSPYNLEMLAAMDRGNVEGGRAVSDRRTTLYSGLIQQQQVFGGRRPTPVKQPSLADIAAVLFAESQIPYEFVPRTTVQWQQVSGVMLFQQGASQTAINGSGPHADAYKAVVGKWLATRDDPLDLAQLVYQLGSGNLRQLPETQPLLRRIVLLEGVAGYAKGQALNFIIQQNGKDAAALLKAVVKGQARAGDFPEVFKKGDNPNKVVSLGSDGMVTQVWFQRNQNQNGGIAAVAETHTVTLRDVALAFLVTQAGQNMRDYGFETQPNQNFTPTPASFGQYAFTSEEKRQAAFVKFGFFQMKQALRDKDGKTPAPKDSGPPIPADTAAKPQPQPGLPAPPLPIMRR